MKLNVVNLTLLTRACVCFQNKVFVYRGKEYEKIGEFVVRIQSQYPSAQVGNYSHALSFPLNFVVVVVVVVVVVSCLSTA